MNTDRIFQILEAAIATKSTEELMLMHGILDADESIDEEGRMMRAAIAEVVTNRHNLAADIDAILEADEDFEMTYGQAMVIALAKVAA